MKKLRRRLKHFLVAHKGNKYKPQLFSRESVAIIALILLLIEGAYLVQKDLVLNNTGFLATVLPAALTTLANADRVQNGVPPVTEDPLLDEAAQAKANDMATKGYFAHVSPDGKTPWYWLQQVGYPYTYAGENLAEDFTDSSDVETAWMNSPEHRANILKPEYTNVGIATAQGMYQGQEVTFVVEFFAAKQSQQTAAAPVTVTPSPKPVAINSVPATVTAETSVPSPQVLGTQSSAAGAQPPPHSHPDPLAVVSTSPTSIVWYLVTAITAFIALFFSLAVFVHIRKNYFRAEMLAGGLVLVGLGVAILMWNSSQLPIVRLPSDTQSASVGALSR